MRLSSESIVELCKVVAALTLLGGQKLVSIATPPLGAVETLLALVGLGGAALAQKLENQKAQEVEEIINAIANRVSNESKHWLVPRGPGGLAKRELALRASEWVLPMITPSAQDLVELGLDRKRVIAFYLSRAALTEKQTGFANRPQDRIGLEQLIAESDGATASFFADIPGNEIPRELLSEIVGNTFDTVLQSPEVTSAALAKLLANDQTLLAQSKETATRLDTLPDNVARRVIELLRPELVKNAELRGLGHDAIIAMAARLKPNEVLDLERAKTEIEHAIDIALDVINRGNRGSNFGQFVDVVLARVAAETREGQFDRAASEVDAALSELNRRDHEHKTAVLNARIALMETGVQQEILRRDVNAAARRIEMLVALQTEKRPVSLSREFLKRVHSYYDEGARGYLISLEIALPLARMQIRDARTSSEITSATILVATVLTTLGEYSSRPELIEEAVRTFNAVLVDCTRERDPVNWSIVQTNLGTALLALGKPKSEGSLLEQGATAYREALKEFTRDQAPLQWATIQNNLGHALCFIGDRMSGTTAHLEEAVIACRQALKVRTRERVPLDWATTLHNLGNALTLLGERQSGTALLKQAATAYRRALQERTKQRAPLLWANSKKGLGMTLRIIGAREKRISTLEQAVATLREALEVLKPDYAPIDWAVANESLGNALLSQGELETGTTLVEEAVIAFREALKGLDRGRTPLGWAGTQNNLGNALSVLGTRETGTAHLEEAVAAYQDALSELTLERSPHRWAAIQRNLGEVLKLLGEKLGGTDGAAKIKQANACFARTQQGLANL